MNNLDAFAKTFAETTMQAAVDIGRSRGIDFSRVDLDVLCAALRVEAKASLDGFLTDGKVLAEGGRAPWLPTLLRAACTEAASRALDTMQAAA